MNLVKTPFPGKFEGCLRWKLRGSSSLALTWWSVRVGDFGHHEKATLSCVGFVTFSRKDRSGADAIGILMGEYRIGQNDNGNRAACTARSNNNVDSRSGDEGRICARNDRIGGMWCANSRLRSVDHLQRCTPNRQCPSPGQRLRSEAAGLDWINKNRNLRLLTTTVGNVKLPRFSRPSASKTT